MNNGIVTNATQDLAIVRVQRQKECEGCNACGVGLKPFIDLKCENKISAKVGDEVDIKCLKRSRTFKILFYIIPLLFMLGGIWIGAAVELVWLSIVLAFIMGGISFGGIYLGYKKIFKKVCDFAIIKIKEKNNENN